VHAQALEHCPGYRFDRWHGTVVPARYSEVFEDYFAATERVAVLDASPVPTWVVRGEQGAQVLDGLSTRGVAELVVGQRLESAMLRQDGTVLARLWVRRVQADQWLVSADVDRTAWLEQACEGTGVQLERRLACQLSLVGPAAPALLQALGPGLEVGAWGPPVPHCTLIVDETMGPQLWRHILETGQTWGVSPMGTECLHTLSIECGHLRWPSHVSLDPTTDPATRTPWALGLGRHLREPGTAAFVGAGALRGLDRSANGLVACRLDVDAEMVEALYAEEGLAAPHVPIPRAIRGPVMAEAGTLVVGQVRAHVWSPGTKRFCVLAQIQRAFLGASLRIQHRPGSTLRQLPVGVAAFGDDHL
jgi:glycine cleavage system aminomethyltransferase T